MEYLKKNHIYHGRAEKLITQVEPCSVALSFWSPPYFVGKQYEKDETFDSWQNLLKEVIAGHFEILKPGGFMVVNIADILAFPDEAMPRFQAMNPSNRRVSVTKEMVLEAIEQNPDFNRYQLAELLGCSEQTIDRRLHGNNIRGGKKQVQTRVKLVGAYLETYAYEVGLYLYDKRIWKKDPAWANSRWTSNTLKAVSETEDLYVFWKPGEYIVNRDRLSADEWKAWGYRQIWEIGSVRKNDIHEAMFPEELAERVIRLYTDEGDTVLDPFMGSGTTAVSAIKHNRNYIGFEKEKKYVTKSLARIGQAQSEQLTLPLTN